MSYGCRCNSRSVEPCRFCQWAEEHHPECGKRYNDCECDRCRHCDGYPENCSHNQFCANTECEIEEVHTHTKSELQEFLNSLYADLDVEIDLHGGRTEMARNIRTTIIETEKELES